MPNEAFVSACETHLSRLFFTPDRVYKLLKPVRLPFVDFRDSADRCRAATVEYERNREISPDVYLGLADVVEDGELTDRMIVMRRLADHQALHNMLQAPGSLPAGTLHDVARFVAGLHARRTARRGVAAEPATLDAVTENWQANFDAIEPFVGPLIEPAAYHRVVRLVETYLDGRGPLFQQRIDEGWVRDGHGDLRAEHIYYTADGPRAIDCVAFDERLRVSDCLADVAFLAMDLDRLAGPPAAVDFMRSWNEFTNEHHPSSLAHFYVAYRAHVRSKIACLRYDQGDASAAQEAREYHALAVRHLEHARIRIVLVGGGPGSGKSTVAEGLARSLGAVWLRSDEIRKDVAGAASDALTTVPDEGLYAASARAKTTAEMMRQAELLVRRGVSVVLDATWRDGDDRKRARALGDDGHAQVAELCCVLPRAIAKERIVRRMASVYNPSDATPELVDYLASRFADWPEAVLIDTNQTVAASIDAAYRGVVGSCSAPVAAPQPERFGLDLAVLRNAILLGGGLAGRRAE